MVRKLLTATLLSSLVLSSHAADVNEIRISATNIRSHFEQILEQIESLSKEEFESIKALCEGGSTNEICRYHAQEVYCEAVFDVDHTTLPSQEIQERCLLNHLLYNSLEGEYSATNNMNWVYESATGIPPADVNYSLMSGMTQTIIYTQMLTEEYTRLKSGGDYSLVRAIGICMSLTNNDVRVGCMRDIYTYLQIPIAADEPKTETPDTPPQADRSAWTSTSSTDPIDDSPSVNLINLSDSGAVLVLRCQQNKTDAYVRWADRFFTRDESETVFVRVDDEAAIKQQWTKSTDGTAHFIPSPITFIKTIAESQRLTIRITPSGKAPQTETFDMTGLNLTELRAACNW